MANPIALFRVKKYIAYFLYHVIEKSMGVKMKYILFFFTYLHLLGMAKRSMGSKMSQECAAETEEKQAYDNQVPNKAHPRGPGQEVKMNENSSSTQTEPGTTEVSRFEPDQETKDNVETSTHSKKRRVTMDGASVELALGESQKMFVSRKDSYDFSKSTEAVYALEEGQEPDYTNSIYDTIRRSLDYSYHKHYSKERRQFQDQIVNYVMDACNREGMKYCRESRYAPWAVFTAGVMGVGKSHVMRWLNQHGHFPYSSFVRIDPDEVRQLLPELEGYKERDMESAGSKTHREAGYICEIVTKAALQDGRNVLIDGSLQDAEWYTFYFRHLKETYPKFRIAIMYITAPKESILERAAKRALVTGRQVPAEVLRNCLERVPGSVEILSALRETNYTATITNLDGEDPQIISPSTDWIEFDTQWEGNCAQTIEGQRFKVKLQAGLSSDKLSKIY